MWSGWDTILGQARRNKEIGSGRQGAGQVETYPTKESNCTALHCTAQGIQEGMAWHMLP